MLSFAVRERERRCRIDADVERRLVDLAVVLDAQRVGAGQHARPLRPANATCAAGGTCGGF